MARIETSSGWYSDEELKEHQEYMSPTVAPLIFGTAGQEASSYTGTPNVISDSGKVPDEFQWAYLKNPKVAFTEDGLNYTNSPQVTLHPEWHLVAKEQPSNAEPQEDPIIVKTKINIFDYSVSIYYSDDSVRAHNFNNISECKAFEKAIIGINGLPKNIGTDAGGLVNIFRYQDGSILTRKIPHYGNVPQKEAVKAPKTLYQTYKEKCKYTMSTLLHLNLYYDGSVFDERNGKCVLKFANKTASSFITVKVDDRELILTPSKLEKTIIHALTRTKYEGKLEVKHPQFTVSFDEKSARILNMLIPIVLKNQRSSYEWIEPMQELILKSEQDAIKRSKNRQPRSKKPSGKPKWAEGLKANTPKKRRGIIEEFEEDPYPPLEGDEFDEPDLKAKAAPPAPHYTKGIFDEALAKLRTKAGISLKSKEEVKSVYKDPTPEDFASKKSQGVYEMIKEKGVQTEFKTTTQRDFDRFKNYLGDKVSSGEISISHAMELLSEAEKDLNKVQENKKEPLEQLVGKTFFALNNDDGF